MCVASILCTMARLRVVVAQHIQQREVGARDLPVRYDVRQRDGQRHLQRYIQCILQKHAKPSQFSAANI